VTVPVIAFLFVILFIGCAATPIREQAAQQEEPAYVANFEYTPSSQVAPNSAGVTFGVGSVFYQSNSKTPWFTWPQFANLDKATKQDLSKLLAAKGFTVRGPFDSYDLIPYSDKKETDLYLVPTFEISVLGSKREVYSINDVKFEVNGNITLQLREIVTRELMWSKTIPFKKFDSPPGLINFYRVTWENYNPKTFNDTKVKKFIKEVELSTKGKNEAAKGIEKQYPELMDTISRLIDPEEMRIIKKQCQELRSKKGY
jgi:hypothetical protein